MAWYCKRYIYDTSHGTLPYCMVVWFTNMVVWFSNMAPKWPLTASAGYQIVTRQTTNATRSTNE